MARFNSLLAWLEWQEIFHPRLIDLGLDRVASVFKALNPDAIKPLTIIVAGTNGKGSCIAFLEAIYRAEGYRVGVYTSPHILKYNERIKIDGLAVTDEAICQAFNRIDAVRGDISLSYFEFGTLAALDIFWRSGLDIQLLEVGLGGRLDAVNIVEPDISLITSICIDHIDWLGETREAIGREKAGIFRTGVPAIIGDINPPSSLLQKAAENKTPLLSINQAFVLQINEHDWDWFYPHQARNYLSLPTPALNGVHQYRNAAAVLMVLTQMEDKIPVSEQSIHNGLQSVQLQGRVQWVSGHIPILLDVAHNPQAVRELLGYLVKHFSEKKIYAVFSMMKDKDIKAVIKVISPVIYHWFITPLNNPRSASESLMQDCFKFCRLSNVSFGFQNFSETLKTVEKKAKSDDLILIFGSFFLVSEYLASTGSKTEVIS